VLGRSQFLETRRVRVLEAFLMLNPALFLLLSFLQQTLGGFQKIEKINFPLFQYFKVLVLRQFI
jgi:hypothetical protein